MQKHQYPNKHDSSTQETSGHHRSTSEPLEWLYFCVQSPFLHPIIYPHNKQTTLDKILSQQSIKNYTVECCFLMMSQSDEPESLINDYAIHFLLRMERKHMKTF